jgi:nickel/cobalt exporter
MQAKFLWEYTSRVSIQGVRVLTMIGPILLTAAVLGITHGIEPDHAAGILSLTSESGDSRLAAIIGACFATGHVILVGIWIGIAQLLFEMTSFPQFIEPLGTAVLGVVLVLLGVTIGFLGSRKLIHTHEHSHGDEGVHHHYHVHLPIIGNDHHSLAAPPHAHDHSTVEYLRIGVIGALFTLSPPLSMMAFISIVIADVGGETVALVVGIYAIAIILTMAVIGSGIGMVFTRVRAHGTKIHATAQLFAAVLVFLYGCYFLWQAVPSIATHI